MSVVVDQLTKSYGIQKAIDSLNFSVSEGEIVGLLGPNGAGKTTTMKILSGYIPATFGQATVYGNSVETHPLEVKKMIGYLPEHNPLYLNMYVKEYLGMVAKIHKLENQSSRVSDVIEMTGLGIESHKKIKMLSKGYRQRVGLAQAIIHEPKVLILDEPTSGLDPNQLIEIRQLISQLGKNRIVIFSSHIMQEVQALCSRVIILNRGQLIADSPMESLVSQLQGSQLITVEYQKPIDLNLLKSLSEVETVIKVKDGIYQVTSQPGKDIRTDLFDLAVNQSNRMVGLTVEKQDMQDVFQTLTAQTNEV